MPKASQEDYIMFCCEIKPDVPDLVVELKQSALDEVKQKRVVHSITVLTRCANPYAIAGNVVVFKDRNSYTVYDCGYLVFLMVFNNLERYTCGNWTDALSDEAKAIKIQRSRVKKQDRMQSLSNQSAARNYVTC
jgi:hypothetical protein